MSKAPKLRFPEFEGEWEEKELAEISESESSSLSLNKLNLVEEGYAVYGADGEVGLINNYDQKNKYIAIIKDGSGVGKIFLYKGKTSVLATLSYLKSRNKIVLEWLYYLLQTIDLKSYVKGSGIPHIYFSDYSRQLIYKPQEEEQQKIADCLSALDEQIAAEEEALEALKAYKKGLLQQLFPQEVSNNYPPPLTFSKLPKLRFAGFEGEWEEVKLGEICNITNGKANVQDHIEGGRYPLFDRSEVVKASNEYFLDCETVILPGEGIRFTPKYYKGKFNLHQRAYALKDFSCSGLFLSYAIYAKKDLLATKAVQSTVLSLRLPILQNFEICIPVDIAEQEKIANCLSSLDELIETKNEKIKLLKSYKKGLLQQMFVN